VDPFEQLSHGFLGRPGADVYATILTMKTSDQEYTEYGSNQMLHAQAFRASCLF
jgi:hypothetical protein